MLCSASGLSASRILFAEDTMARARSPKMTAAKRRSLRLSQFAIPERRAYPVDTRGRGANALSRVAQHGSDSEKARVRAKVCKRYPSLPFCKARR